MEAGLRMKITDFSIIFAVIFISFYLTYFISEQAAYSSAYSATVVNHVMDEIVRDSLEAGYRGTDDDGIPIIERDALIQAFQEECARLLEGHKYETYIPSFVKKIILIESDHYFVYEQGVWSQAILFDDMTHEERVRWISKSLEKSLYQQKEKRYRIQIPLNHGEWDSQTLKEYGILVLCEDNIFQFQGERYGRYFLSGAALKEE